MPGGDDKPMDVFGPQWDRHFLRISENWRNTVGEEDIVLVPGDISWAMQLKDAIPDLEEIGRLPGKKILCKGNHEYWWSGIGRVRAALPEGMTAWRPCSMMPWTSVRAWYAERGDGHFRQNACPWKPKTGRSSNGSCSG